MEREKERQVEEETTWLEDANDETFLTRMSGFKVKREAEADGPPFCKIASVVSGSIPDEDDDDDDDEDWNRVTREAVVRSEKEKAKALADEERKIRLMRQKLSHWRAEARRVEKEAFNLADRDPDGREREARLARKKKRRLAAKMKSGEEETIVGMEERTSSPEIPHCRRISPERFNLVKKNLRRAWMEEKRAESQLANLLAKKEVTSFRPTEDSSSDKIYVIRVASEENRDGARRRKRLLSALRRAQETPEQREERLAKQREANQRIRVKQLLEKHETAEERTARLAMTRAMRDAGHRERIAEAERKLADKVRKRMRIRDVDPGHATEKRERYLARKREDSRRFRERERERRLEAYDNSEEKAERHRLRRGVASVTREECKARTAQMRLLDGSDEEEEDSPWWEEQTASPRSQSNGGTNDSDAVLDEKLVFLVPVKQYISLTGKKVEQLPPVVAMPVAGGAEKYIESGVIASDVLPNNQVYPVGISPSLAVNYPTEPVEIVVPDLPETREWPLLAINSPIETVESVLPDLPETQELPTLAVNYLTEADEIAFPDLTVARESPTLAVNQQVVVKTEPEDILGTPENHQWQEIIFNDQVVRVKTEPMDSY